MASSDSRTTSRTGPTSVWLAERPAPAERRRAAVPRSRSGQARDAGSAGGGAVAERGGQPDGLDRERITAASVRLLDADGLAGFSMRRLAAELGVTAMSVYWYVRSKDDLLELALDAVQGELALPDPADEDADWRDQLRLLAHEYRRMFRDHPWASRMSGSCLNVGPHAMAFSAAAHRIVRRSGLPAQQVPGGLAALFRFVLGFGTVEVNWHDRCQGTGLTADEYREAVYETVRARPEYADLAHGPAEAERERDFGVALDCVIAGIEALRDRPGGGPSPS